jgi:hypothetical protein
VRPDPTRLLQALALREPLISFCDAPDPQAFAPLVEAGQGHGRGACIFDYRPRWLAGETLHLTRQSRVCGGALRTCWGVLTRSREDFITFLYEEEGLRASRELMEAMIDEPRKFDARYEHILIGPLKLELYDYVRTITFYVNPDQLSVLQLGAYYAWRPASPPPVIAPFSSGCGELVAVFDDLDAPQAAVGATDIAMRDVLPPDLLAFTVTRLMFEQLCALDDRSFLGKGFLEQLKRARGDAWGAPCGTPG